MGKSFRNWISEKLLLNNKDIKLLIEDVMDNTREIKSFWKDEIFTSILFFYLIIRMSFLKTSEESY
jgi:hypothetical protein